MTAREQQAYHGIPNEIVAAWLIESIYAADKLEQARRAAAITLPAHIAAAAMQKDAR